jgi:AmmeMemoRadiSam system protein A
MSHDPSPETQRALLALARSVIAARLGVPAPPVDLPDDPLLGEPRGAFTTLHLAGTLRGCIGYIEAVEALSRTIEETAVAAAFHDPRFPPLVAREYPLIDLEISVLSPLEPLADPADLVPGKHGLVVSRGARRGLLLPQVAVEQGWDRETFLSHTCLKAGLPPDAWRSGTSLEVFTACVFGEKQ